MVYSEIFKSDNNSIKKIGISDGALILLEMTAIETSKRVNVVKASPFVYGQVDRAARQVSVSAAREKPQQACYSASPVERQLQQNWRQQTRLLLFSFPVDAH